MILLVPCVDVCSMKRLSQNGGNVEFPALVNGSTAERKEKNNYSFLPSYCLYISPVIRIMAKMWIDTG